MAGLNVGTEDSLAVSESPMKARDLKPLRTWHVDLLGVYGASKIMAHWMEVHPSGALVFYVDQDDPFKVTLFAPGQWLHVQGGSTE